MASPQHGIARQRQTILPPKLSGGTDPASLRRDLTAALGYTQKLGQQIRDLELQLTRRINEMVIVDTLANRPAAGVQDRIYVAFDQPAGARVTYDTGSAWISG